MAVDRREGGRRGKNGTEVVRLKAWETGVASTEREEVGKADSLGAEQNWEGRTEAAERWRDGRTGFFQGMTSFPWES